MSVAPTARGRQQIRLCKLEFSFQSLGSLIEMPIVVCECERLNPILLEEVAFAPNVHRRSLMENISSIPKITFRPHITVTMETTMSEDDVVGVGDYEGAAAGWGALKAVADAVRGQMAIVKETRGLLSMYQPHGFD